MESKITVIRDNKGKVLGTKRRNPTTKPVINKPLTVDGKQVFNISELMRKRQCGEELTNMEAKILDEYIMQSLPTVADVKAKMARGEKLTIAETNVLLADIKKTEAEYAVRRKKKISMVTPLSDTVSSKTEIPQKTIVSESERYFQQQENIRQIERDTNIRRTSYRPIDRPKGGTERAMEKFGELSEIKAKLIERNSKITEKFTKILEYCKKYGKSIKA